MFVTLSRKTMKLTIILLIHQSNTWTIICKVVVIYNSNTRGEPQDSLFRNKDYLSSIFAMNITYNNFFLKHFSCMDIKCSILHCDEVVKGPLIARNEL